MSDATARDDWGFSDADRSELQALMDRHHAQLAEIMHAVLADGIKPLPEDEGMMGWLARTSPDDERQITRVFHRGGFWWALLEHLRTLDRDEKGGA